MEYKDIIGHEVVIEGLKRAVQNGNISHFYIFEGEEGLGKKTIGRVFAKTLLCLQKKESPCGECTSCRKFDSDSHPDYHETSPERGMIRLPEIEKIIRNIAMSPFESEKKVFLMDEAHTMNRESQNALLKTLEETPSYAHIILVTSSSKDLLPTIRSRGQNIRFYPVDVSHIKNMLVTGYNADEKKAAFLAGFTAGSPGRAISLLEEQEFFEDRDYIIDLIDALLKGERHKIFSSEDWFAQRKDKIDRVLNVFLLWFRDLLLYKAAENENLILNSDKLALISLQSRMDFEQINGIIEKIMDTSMNVSMNVNYQLSIETMLLKIQEEF